MAEDHEEYTTQLAREWTAAINQNWVRNKMEAKNE